MHTLIFATNNRHKVEEVRSSLAGLFRIVSLQEAGIDQEIPEPHDTLEENAFEKSSFIHRLTGNDCFSEDSGLEVTALHGAPGVRSARYAGDHADSGANIARLLKDLQDSENRRARFRTIISLILNGKELRFEGVCDGRISQLPEGSSGFGYDPVFIPDGDSRTFGCMTMEEKNFFSHRRKAVDKMIEFLHAKNHQNPQQSFHSE
jgi:XTP/dITP diphosphohydrolase